MSGTQLEEGAVNDSVTEPLGHPAEVVAAIALRLPTEPPGAAAEHGLRWRSRLCRESRPPPWDHWRIWSDGAQQARERSAPPRARLFCELAPKPTVEFTDVMFAGYQHTAVAVHA